jgi:hypothetical protein
MPTQVRGEDWKILVDKDEASGESLTRIIHQTSLREW